MFLRIYFSDNDFCTPILMATKELRDEILGGLSPNSFKEQFEKFYNKHGMDNIRKRILLGSVGSYILRKGVLGRFEEYDDYGFNSLISFDNVLNYLDSNIDVSLVDDINLNDENSESCYIDIDHMTVDLY